ncbi:hypothetical protein VK792_12960 [Mesobacterium sp. TK19101]|uniref:Uncharacterized protein n=1 Tax=Mesobacterium hydrothermale TaxID=3111907 RepID=A0ABU6HJB1_9RHOB|nr:hypothetical protein [Mesobacterium sp. TK19101]MEC3862197.1 hypothetical protein [Mesobacterium sp. TK19101]
MKVETMYGVVLWSDESERKAVIWCEDHGELAYFSANDQSALSGMPLDAGDLIQFDVRTERDLRRARNLRLVGERQYPAIAERLTGRTGQRPTGAENVVAFAGAPGR